MPGHAQAVGEAIIAGVKYRAHFFVMTLPHSDACFVAAYPAATTEAWLDGHNRAFVFFGGVPQLILYDAIAHLVRWHAATVQRAAVPLPLRGPLRPSPNDKGNGGGGRLCPALRRRSPVTAGTPSMAPGSMPQPARQRCANRERSANVRDPNAFDAWHAPIPCPSPTAIFPTKPHARHPHTGKIWSSPIHYRSRRLDQAAPLAFCRAQPCAVSWRRHGRPASGNTSRSFGLWRPSISMLHGRCADVHNERNLPPVFGHHRVRPWLPAKRLLFHDLGTWGSALVMSTAIVTTFHRIWARRGFARNAASLRVTQALHEAARVPPMDYRDNPPTPRTGDLACMLMSAQL